MNKLVKKYDVIALVIIMILCMTGCGDKEDTKVKQKTEVDEFNKEITIEETVLLDEKGIVVTASELTYGKYGAELHLFIENNSDSNYVVSTGYIGGESICINGQMVLDGYMDELVNSGESSEAIIEFGYSELRSKGIYEITEITMGFGLMLENDYNYIDRCWPYVIKTSSTKDVSDFAGYKRGILDGTYNLINECTLDYFDEKTIFSENGVEIISQAVVTNEYGEKTLLLETVNNSDEMYIYYVENVYINGILVADSELAKGTLFPGATNIIEINLYYFMGDDEEFEIYEFDDIKFDFILRNKDFDVVLDDVSVEYKH